MSPQIIPCLGYESRTAAVLAKRAEGMSDKEIAALIGIKPSRVSALACAKSARGAYASAKRPAIAGTNNAINIEFRTMLRGAALKRKVSVDALIVLLIEKIAEDQLVDAVLDDEGVSYT